VNKAESKVCPSIASTQNKKGFQTKEILYHEHTKSHTLLEASINFQNLS